MHSLLFLNCCCCCHRLAGKGRSNAPQWPRLTACLQRSTGGRLLSFQIWSTHLLRGRPGLWCHWLLGGRPRDRLTWPLSALWAGMSSGSLAMWPKRALRRWLMVSEKQTSINQTKQIYSAFNHPVLHAWRLPSRTWNQLTSPWTKQQTWLRIVHCGH